MNDRQIKHLLENVASGELSPEAALAKLRHMPFEDLGFAKVDHHRGLRKGLPEVIYGAGKTPDQICKIIDRMKATQTNILVTRCSPEVAQAVQQIHPDMRYHETARAMSFIMKPPEKLPGYVAILTAGTSDLPIASEAAVTCNILGVETQEIYDVGVAGIHRLFAQKEIIENARVVIVCAGMEGALPSVVGGLVDCPVIAVPTSVGYGTSFGGVTPLLAMLNSCATGVAVVNIDNGFGAGVLAATIMRSAHRFYTQKDYES